MKPRNALSAVAAVSLVLFAGIRLLAPDVLSGAAAQSPESAVVQQSAPTSSAATSQQPPLKNSCEEPLDLVPAESLLTWYGRPLPDTTPAGSGPSIFNRLINVGLRLAPLNPTQKLYARILEGFGMAVGHPHAFVLINAQARPVDSDPNARRVDKPRFAAIIEIGDRPEAEQAFGRLIQMAVNEQTDQSRGALQVKKAQRWEYQELRDERLPDTIIAWGRIGQHLVIAVGPDVWPSIAAVAAGEAPALSRANWLEQVRGERGRRALIEIIVAAGPIRERLDPFVSGRATAFFEAWDAEQVERAHWALGFEGRALYCVAHFLENGQVRERIYADPNIRDPRLIAVIPEDARYAIYHVAPTRFLPRFIDGWLATGDPQSRVRIEQLWARIQEQYEFNAERDILGNLGDNIIMHNFPPHPLHLPLAMTTLTEIRSNPQRVQDTMKAMCQAWQAELTRIQEKEGKPNPFQVEHDGRGLWHIQYPWIAGPAWIVTDRFIITSWSPQALREYLDRAGDRVGKLPG